MLYVIQDKRTRRFYRDRTVWAQHMDKARTFEDRATAEAHIHLLPSCHSPDDMEIIPVTLVTTQAVLSLAPT